MPALKPSTTGMRPMTVFAARCVCPATTRSTVVFCSLLDDPDDRALPRRRRAAVDRVGAGRRALVDHHDLDPHALRAELRRLALDPLGLVEEREARRVPGLDELRRVAHDRADHADPHAVDAEDRGRLHPRRLAAGRSSRRRWWPGTGSSRGPDAAGCARSRSRTRGCRSSWRRAPTRSPRRSPGCPAAAPSSAARRPRCRPRPAATTGLASAASSSSNSVASCPAPPTPTVVIVSSVVAAGSSCPWKSFSPMMLTGVKSSPSSMMSRRTTPWLCCGAGTPSRNAAVGARSMLRTSSASPRSIASPPARNVARMLVLDLRSCSVRDVAVLAEERRARDQRAGRRRVELVRRRARRPPGRRSGSGAPCPRSRRSARSGCSGPRPW